MQERNYCLKNEFIYNYVRLNIISGRNLVIFVILITWYRVNPSLHIICRGKSPPGKAEDCDTGRIGIDDNAAMGGFNRQEDIELGLTRY